MTQLVLRDIDKHYGQTQVIEQLSLTVEDGEFLVLLGFSGSGKSTLLRIIAGLEAVSSGTVEFDGRLVASDRFTVSPDRRELGFVFQNYALWPHLSVLGNIAYPLRARHVARAEARRRAQEALELVQLGGLGERRVSDLSGGQQQRVAIARAIVARPSIILFDEPLSNLDTQLRGELRQQIKQLHRQLGFTAVYVTHDYAEALALGQRIAVLEQGRLLQVDRVDDIARRPSSSTVARFVGFDSFLDARIIAAGPQSTYAVEVDGGLARFDAVPGPAGLVPGQGAVIGTKVSEVSAEPSGEASSGAGIAGAGQAAAPTASVLALDYTAAGFAAQLQTDSGALIRARLAPTIWGFDPEPRLAADGGRVRLAFNTDGVVLIPHPVAEAHARALAQLQASAVNA